MSVFDNAEKLAAADLEFLKRSLLLVEEVYGTAENTHQDILIIESILSVAMHREASMMVAIGAASVDEAYAMMHTSEAGAEEGRANYCREMLGRAFDLIRERTKERMPELLEEVRLRNQVSRFDMQADFAANNPNFSS